MKWKLYWASMISIMVGLVFWKNHRLYPGKGYTWWITKTVVEAGILVIVTMYAPVLLVVYGSMWITESINIKSNKLKIGLGVLIGMMLALLADLVLEVLVVLGIFSIELVSRDFIKYYLERRSSHE